jgi:hypothetical protein
MSQTKSSIRADSGLAAGSDGTLITKVLKGTVAVTIGAIAAGAEADVEVTVAQAAAGDIVAVTPLNAAMETGVGILAAWVSEAGKIKIRFTNAHTSGLTGSTSNFSYLLIKS